MTNVNVLLLVVVAAVVVVVVIVVVMIVVVVVVVLVVILIVVLLYQGVHAGDAEGPGRGDDTVGDPHRAQSYRFYLFDIVLLVELDKQFSIEQFEATVFQSTIPCPPLRPARRLPALRGLGHIIS